MSGKEPWTAVKNILKYLHNTKDMILVYGGNMERELRVFCYTDVGYLADADNLKSQTGFVFVLNGGNMERELRVSCYTDVGYLADADNLKSQTGFVFVLNGGVVD
nr:retrotransposon protein, putative, Ty1-copia subclass [Tanacetum cinerariifolium]